MRMGTHKCLHFEHMLSFSVMFVILGHESLFSIVFESEFLIVGKPTLLWWEDLVEMILTGGTQIV